MVTITCDKVASMGDSAEEQLVKLVRECRSVIQQGMHKVQVMSGEIEVLKRLCEVRLLYLDHQVKSQQEKVQRVKEEIEIARKGKEEALREKEDKFRTQVEFKESIESLEKQLEELRQDNERMRQAMENPQHV
jgi:chromosome segregation ATPase